MLGGTENLNGSRIHNHAPGRFVVGGLELAMIKLCTKFEISTFTH